MRKVKVFKVILGIDKRGDIHSGWLDPQLSSKHFYNYLTMDSCFLPEHFYNYLTMDSYFLPKQKQNELQIFV